MTSALDGDNVVELDLGVVPSPSGSGEVLIRTEDGKALLVFVASRWNAAQERLEPAGTALATFSHCLVSRFGYPNDEARRGHPLDDRVPAPLGPGPRVPGFSYGIYEVVRPSWLALIQEMNRRAFPHSAWPGAAYRHFIVACHETTLEVLAQDIDVEISARQLGDVLRDVASHLDSSS